MRAAWKAQLGCQTQSYGVIGLGLHTAPGGRAQGQGRVASGLALEGSVEKPWERSATSLETDVDSFGWGMGLVSMVRKFLIGYLFFVLKDAF